MSSYVREPKPFNTEDIKVLLLENVKQIGQDILRKQGYQVESLKSSLPEDQLTEKSKEVHVLGTRSKTQITAAVMRQAKNLLSLAASALVPIRLTSTSPRSMELQFSAFHSATREALQSWSSPRLSPSPGSIANAQWKCTRAPGTRLALAAGKSELSVLAEAVGMKAMFYDVVNLVSMGTAKQVPSLHELLQNADFVTLHVPESPETKNLMGAAQFDQVKQGSYLINASRGSVVDIQAMIDASRSGKLVGAALDVYPDEPAANGDYFNNELNTWAAALRGCKNITFTPHIGGSTEEAQRAIGLEVAAALVGYVNEGSTLGAVNMPEVNLRSITAKEPNHVRVIYVHKNLPGVLRRVNEILGNHNIDKQMTDSRKDVAYLKTDIGDVHHQQIKEIYDALEELSSCLRTRLLH